MVALNMMHSYGKDLSCDAAEFSALQLKSVLVRAKCNGVGRTSITYSEDAGSRSLHKS